MGVFLRVFDPKGFRNNYTGSNWRKVERQQVEPIEATRGHNVRTELEAMRKQQQAKPPAFPPVAPKEEDQEDEENAQPAEQQSPHKTTLKPAKKPSKLEKEIVTHEEFFGPGEITAIAKDVMDTDFPAFPLDTTISEVAQTLKKHRYSHLPVVTKKDRICGLVTETQLFRKLVDQEAEQGRWGKMPVEKLMISPVLCCLLETPILTLIDTLIDENIGLLPVVNGDDRLQGVVTMQGLLEYIRNSSHFFSNKK